MCAPRVPAGDSAGPRARARRPPGAAPPAAAGGGARALLAAASLRCVDEIVRSSSVMSVGDDAHIQDVRY